MIQSVERAFALLYTIAQNKDRITISQLARDVGSTALGAPQFRIQNAAHETQIAEWVRDTARQLSERLQKGRMYGR